MRRITIGEETHNDTIGEVTHNDTIGEVTHNDTIVIHLNKFKALHAVGNAS